MKISAQYHNDNSSSYKDVFIEFFSDGVVQVSGDLNFQSNIDDIEFSQRVGNTHRVLRFPDLSVAYSFDNDTIDKVLKEFKNQKSIIYLLESKMKYAIFSGIFLIVTTIFFLTVGSSYVANMISKIVPYSMEKSLSDRTLLLLDDYILEKSDLNQSRQDEIREIFKSVTKNNPKYHLHFRKGISENAFALPSGDIVISDELIKFSKNDNDMIYGVLAHEMGHVVNKHLMKILVKSAISSAIISYFTGDISSLAVTLSTSALNAKNSRAFEHEADVYAKKRMLEANKSPKHLADFFIRIDKKHHLDKNSNFFSSHPSDKDRIEYLLSDAH